ncbi:hypothetical protein ACG5V6_26840, partial [Streptomyces chitinivorans]
MADVPVGVGGPDGDGAARLQFPDLLVAQGVLLGDLERRPGGRVVGYRGGLAVGVGAPDDTADGVEAGGAPGL